MKPDAYLPFYGNDFFAATDGLSEIATLAYLRALWHYWSHTHCTGLPEDDEYLRRVCRCQTQEWARTKGLLFDSDGPFFRLQQGRWHQSNAANRYLEAHETYQRRVAGAAKARAAADNNPDTIPVISHDNNPLNSLQPKPKPKPESYSDPKPEPEPKSHTHSVRACASESVESKKEGFDRLIGFEQLQGEICQAYNRPVRVFGISSEEHHLIAEISRRPTVKDEWREIKRFKDRIPAKDKRYFPGSAVRLLQNWDATLDRARNYQPDAQHQSLAEKQLKAAITEGYK